MKRCIKQALMASSRLCRHDGSQNIVCNGKLRFWLGIEKLVRGILKLA
jgi:hypothetical protein